MTNMTVEEIIKQSVSDSKLMNQKNRREWVRKMLDYYGGNGTHNYIESYFAADAFREIPCYNANFTRRFVNKMSRIYTVGANRNVSNEYDLLTIKKDARMKHVERMTRLMGTVATQIIYKEVNGMPYFDYRPVYYFNVHLKDPFTPDAILLEALSLLVWTFMPCFLKISISPRPDCPCACIPAGSPKYLTTLYFFALIFKANSSVLTFVLCIISSIIFMW